MPLPIQNARISNLIHEAYNIVGRYRARIDETVVPVVVVDDFSGGGGFPEVRRASAAFTRNAVANEHMVFRLETPPNVLAVIRQITARGSAASLLRVFFGSSFTAPSEIADKNFVDGRIRNRGEAPAAVVSFGTQTAALGTTNYITQVSLLDGIIINNLDWPIGQVGAFDFVEFASHGQNVSWNCALVWDEYLVRP